MLARCRPCRADAGMDMCDNVQKGVLGMVIG